jgi:two-component sensor histidine kinase
MAQANHNHLANELYYDSQTSDSLQILLKNISSLNRAVELQSVLRESLDVIQNVMNVEASSLMLLDQSAGELIVSMPTGPVQKEITGERINESSGIGGWVLQNEEPFYSNSPKKTDVFAGELSDDFVTQNIICVPLRNMQGKVFGVLQALNRRDERGFGDEDVPIFQALSNHVAIAIERIREVENMQNKLEEREMMLTEVHHRLKNNLSTITGLIEMEISDVDDEYAAEVLQKTCSRIESMREIHQLLYDTGLDNRISLKSYLQRLAGKISDMLGHASQNVAVNIKADPVQLDTERAMSCGLLLNELIVNSYKHAFKHNPENPQITIELTESDNKYISLQVSDNGRGIGDEFELEESPTIGSWLINVLLRRLDAAIDISQDDGTSFIIRFKK